MILCSRKLERVSLSAVLLLGAIFLLVKESPIIFESLGELSLYEVAEPIQSDPNDLKVLYPSILEALKTKRLSKGNVDWNKFAYVNYISNEQYLCSAYAQFNMLLKSGSKAQFVVVTTAEFMDDYRLEIIRALSPKQFTVKQVDSSTVFKDDTRWALSLVKLQVFKLVDYDRIIYIDNDAVIQHNMDELFFIPAYIEFAGPLAYWLSDIKYPQVINNSIWSRIEKGKEIYDQLPNMFINKFDYEGPIKPWFEVGIKHSTSWTSMMMVFTPSDELFNEIISRIDDTPARYDMNYINDQFNVRKVLEDQVKRFNENPKTYRPKVAALAMEYAILTNHLRDPNFYSVITQNKNLTEALRATKFVHFSDFPQTPKPMNMVRTSPRLCENHYKNDNRACLFWYYIYDYYFDFAEGCSLKKSTS